MAIKLYKRTSSIMLTVQSTPSEQGILSDERNESGPKTRGASKRRILESTTMQISKKNKTLIKFGFYAKN